MSAGFTPEIRLAIPTVSGLICDNVSRASKRSPASLLKSKSAGIFFSSSFLSLSICYRAFDVIDFMSIIIYNNIDIL